MRKQQNYKNHGRLVYLYHGGVLLAGLILFILSIIQIFYSTEDNFYLSILVAVGVFILLLTAFFARAFALKAQDRVIRAEENFRHHMMTQKPLDSNLRLRQIIALRFASDEEFLALAKRAVDEKLSQKEIKQSINNWKGDYNRV